MIECGLTEYQYYSITQFEFLCIYTRVIKQSYQRMEGTRMLGYLMVKMNTDPKKFKDSITEWMPLATDHIPEKEPIVTMSKEEMLRIANRFNV